MVMFLIVTVISSAFLARFVYRVYLSPSRTYFVCLLDTLFELFSIFKIGPWKKDPDMIAAVDQAFHSTKLNDLGSSDNQDFVTRYMTVRERALKKSNAVFSPAGHYFIAQSLMKRVEVRLRLVDYLKNHPAVEKTKIKDPIFVIGVTRTGTTFLHELLGLHHDVRMHYTWEQMDPIPYTNDESQSALSADRLFRYNKNKGHFAFLFNHVIAQKMQHIHRIGYDEPEECTIPCSLELPWSLSELPFNAYAPDDIFPLGAGKAYHFYRKFLQLMTWQSEDRVGQDFTWMLKCPFHLPYLRELIEEFPGATVVWTHRDPAQCIASACSLYETIMQMGMEEASIDRVVLGRAVMEFTKKTFKMAEKNMEELGDKLKVVHVRYADNIKDSKAVCRRIYEQAGIPFTQNYSDKIDAYLQESAEKRKKMKEQNKSGVVHAYKPEDYGLTAEQIREEFADYIKKYDLYEGKK